MALNLTGARSKIERAKKHIGDLDRERVAFLETDPYICISHFDAEECRTDYVLGPLPFMPVQLALIAGDTIHNLRTSLDHLACELVRDAGHPVGHVCFPICKSAKEYIAKSDEKTKGMPIPAKQFIDALMPYRGPNNMLWGLHQLDIIDKHRLLVPVGTKIANVQLDFMSLTPTAMSLLSTRCALEEGYILGSVGRKVEANQGMKFTFDIAFGEPEVLAGQPIIEALTQITQYIERIVGYFEQSIFVPAP
jgi:hypothetical protein